MRHLFDFRAAARYVGSALAAAAACAALLFTPPAFSRGTNTLDNVSYSTLMWSLSDPFGFDTLDLLSVVATNHEARVTALELAGPGGGAESDPVAYPVATNALAVAGAALPKVATNGWEYGAHLGWLLSVPPQPYTIITNAPWALPSITNGMEYGAHQAWLLPAATNGLASTNYVNAMVSGVDLTRLLDAGNTGYVSHDGTNLSLFASTAYGTFTVVCSNVWNQSLLSPPWGYNGTITLPASSTGASTNSGLWELSINGLYNYAGYSYLRYNGVDVWSDNRYPLNFPITMSPTAGDNGTVTITRSYPVSAIKTFASLADLAAYTNAVVQALGPGAALGATAVQPSELVAATSVLATASSVIAATNTATGGARFGAVTSGSMTLGGSTITEWPTGSGGASASTLTPIYAVATGAVTTVEWSATPRVNYIELATPTVITNSLANLGNCASNVEIEVWVNATSTNALAPVWDARLRWQDGVPDMTVTGLYKFALESACGTNIYARQTWPTRSPCSLLTVSTVNAHYAGYAGYAANLLTTALATNSVRIAACDGNGYSVVDVIFYSGATVPSNAVMRLSGFPDTANATVSTYPALERGGYEQVYGSATPIDYDNRMRVMRWMIAPSDNVTNGRRAYILTAWWETNPGSQNVNVYRISSRQATELEINAGWRP